MILSVEDIGKLAVKPYNGEMIEDAVDQYKLLRMHCTGEGIDDYVQDIEEFMRPGTKDTLVQLMHGNRDLVYRVMSPRDKIYTAKGGVEQYNLPEKVEPLFREYLADVADGLPVKEWIRQRLQPHYDYDPNGLVFIEINDDNNPYPTVKEITSIHDYFLNGRALEYVIFKVDDRGRQAYIEAGLLPANLPTKAEVLRVVDDTTDRLCVVVNKYGKDGKVEVRSEVVNEFGYVPGMIISDMWGYCDKYFESPLSPAVELLNSIMFSNGTFAWAYARQAFPKEWLQKFDCPTCDGHKEVDGATCPECNGSGIMPFLRTADTAVIDYRGDGGEKIPNPPMGVIAPAVEALQFMKDNGMSLEDYIEYTIWGVSRVQSNTKFTSKVAGHGGNVSNTAYEAQLNEQPKHDRLKLFSRWKDSVQSFIADTCGWYKYRNQYDGCAVLGGDRYMIESPDATWDRYTKAVAAKAPMAILDSLLMEYIENKYNNNPLLYRKYLLLMQVEPFVHESVDVIWVDMTLPMIQRLEKKYFDEWTSTLSDYDIASVPDQGGADILRNKLREFVMGKYVMDVQQDTLLLTSSGEILKIGDTVTVKDGKEQKPEHAGATFTVNDIRGMDVTLSNDDTDGLFGYRMNDLQKDSTKMIAA
jgi:hypothetical protein